MEALDDAFDEDNEYTCELISNNSPSVPQSRPESALSELAYLEAPTNTSS